MKFGLFTTTRPAAGLDISGDSFKLMQLHRSGAATEVKGYVDVVLPKGTVINDTITDPKTFAYLIKKALANPDYGHIDTNYVVGSLPESKSFVRVIQVPNLSEAEAETAVYFEAESFIPMPLDQVYLDWQPISEAGDKLNVLIIASPREFVDKYMMVLEDAGLKIAALEVESQSCARAVVKSKSQDTLLVVDLDAYRTSMIMVEQGILQFTSTVPIAGNTFTESIAKALGVPMVKAENIKRKVGIANVPEYPNLKTALLPVLNNLATEIRNIIKFHAEHSSKQVNKILLCGGSAKLKQLPEFLAADLSDLGSMQVEVVNPWTNLEKMKKQVLSPYDALSFTTAIGLAMRGENYEVY